MLMVANLVAASGGGVQIEVLDLASDFASFAFPQRRAVLERLAAPWIAIGARWHGAPAGMILAFIRDDHVWLDSVMVTFPLRRKGIATALLTALADHTRSIGAARISTQYSSFLRGRGAFEALLAHNGWETPALVDIQLVGLAGAMAEGGGAWRPVQRAMRELTDYSVGPFVLDLERDELEIDALLASAPELGVPDPRKNSALDSEVSAVIRHEGRLIGWIAAEVLQHSMGYGTLVAGSPSIYYSGARLADGHHKAMMLVGYHWAFSRQCELHGAASRAVYRTHPAAPAMFAFTRARFAPMALHVEERLGASLMLNKVGSPSGVGQELAPC